MGGASREIQRRGWQCPSTPPTVANTVASLRGRSKARRVANGKADREPTDASYRWATDPDPVSRYTQQCARQFPAGFTGASAYCCAMRSQKPLRAYWRANVRLIAVLLVVWFLTAYVLSIALAPWLNQFRLGNAPLGFWFAQQGSIYVFILLIWIYARRMDALDRQYDVHE